MSCRDRERSSSRTFSAGLLPPVEGWRHHPAHKQASFASDHSAYLTPCGGLLPRARLLLPPQFFGRLVPTDAAAPAQPVSSAPPPDSVRGCPVGEVSLEPHEFIQCVNIWTSSAHGDRVGSLSVTLNSCRVFRFGGSWSPGAQHSPCAPSFEAAIPRGTHVVGLHGWAAPGGGFASLGVWHSPGALNSGPAPRPYKARRCSPFSPFTRCSMRPSCTPYKVHMERLPPAGSSSL